MNRPYYLLRISGGPYLYILREYDCPPLQGVVDLALPAITATRDLKAEELEELYAGGLIPKMLYKAIKEELIENEDFYIYAYWHRGRYIPSFLELSEDRQRLVGVISSRLYYFWKDVFKVFFGCGLITLLFYLYHLFWG